MGAKVVEEIFRRLVLKRLYRTKRLSQEFLHNLLSWRTSGFSAHADEPVEADVSLCRMINHESGHLTIVEVSRAVFDADVPEDRLTIHQMLSILSFGR